MLKLRSLRRDFVSHSRFTKWLLSKEVCAKNSTVRFKESDYSQWAGRTVIVTGVTRGIGFIILKRLLQLKMNVIIGCRNTLVCHELLVNIHEVDHIDTCRAIVLELDFMCLRSVQRFVGEVRGLNTPIHVVLNNARLIGGKFSETSDGFEAHFQANCLSPFLLFNLLLPLLAQTSMELGSPIGRIANVSSGLMCYGKLDLDDLQQRKSYNPLQAYFNSQLIQTLLLRQLFTNVRKDGHTRICVSSVHPGISASELPLRTLSRRIIDPFLMSKENGANQVLYVALSSQLDSVSGEFFLHPSDSSNAVVCVGNQELQEKVWNIAWNYVHPHLYTLGDTMRVRDALAEADDQDRGDDVNMTMESLHARRSRTCHNYDGEDGLDLDLDPNDEDEDDYLEDDTLISEIMDFEL